MSAPDFGFLANDNLTSHETIVELWFLITNLNSAAGVGVPRVHTAFSIDNPFCTVGYIVMQYIDALDSGEGDHQLVVKAVQTLISKKGSSSVPRPVAEVHHTQLFLRINVRHNVRNGGRAPAAH